MASVDELIPDALANEDGYSYVRKDCVKDEEGAIEFAMDAFGISRDEVVVEGEVTVVGLKQHACTDRCSKPCRDFEFWLDECSKDEAVALYYKIC